jgi:ubiquinone biosynthesis protein
VQVRSEDLAAIRRELRRANQRTVLAVVGAACIVSAATIYGLDGFQPMLFGGAPLPVWVLGVLGIYLILTASSGGED